MYGLTTHLLVVNKIGALLRIKRLSTTSGDYAQIYEAMREQARVRDPQAFISINELDPQQCVAGVYWTWSLAGPGGAVYTLHILPGTITAAVEKCERHIRRSYDCLQIYTNRVKRLIDFRMPLLKHEDIDMYANCGQPRR